MILQFVERKDILLFCCDSDGHKKVPGANNHYFVMISDNTYNKKSTSLSAVPLTSPKPENSFFVQNWGIQLSKDDFEGTDFLAGSYIQCDRPCRVKTDDATKSDRGGIGRVSRLNDKAYRKTIEKITTFMMPGIQFK